jgi:hypothetical protein
VRRQFLGYAKSFGTGLDLALISFASLYFEMLIIRWLASDIRVFAYFKNLPLLAAFLGLGLGCARARGNLFSRFPLLCFAFATIVAFAGPLDLVHLYIPQQDNVKFFNDPRLADFEYAVPLLVMKFLLVVFGLFFLVVALFAALGERLGALFNRLPPTRAYSVNLLASLAGIWVFAALSWLGWPPAGWFALGFLVLLRFVGRRPLLLGTLALTLAVVILAPGATRWSPYYRIDVGPISVANPNEQLDSIGYVLGVNHDLFQFALDLSDEFVATHPGRGIDLWRRVYEAPYRLFAPRRVLVVGAGMGNDVATALRHGAERVDAVEIDPIIVEEGRTLHPEHPYLSPGVRVIADDARSFLARSTEQYDLIVFGVLDSHTLLSSMSSLRLDSYVYTLESLGEARAHLAPGGYVALSYSESAGADQYWLTARLFQMVTAVFGEEPAAVDFVQDVDLVVTSKEGAEAANALRVFGRITLLLSGPDVHARVAADPELAPLVADAARLQTAVPLPTDDWPFVFLRDREVPAIPYGGMLAMLMLLGGALVVRGARARGRAPDGPMFLLGAGFMLIEVKSISQLSLLFGSTWIVNAVIISAILILALLSNLFVGWKRPLRVGPAYVLLGVALMVDYFVPLGAMNSQEIGVKLVVGSLLPVLPLMFAGVVFATLFARATDPGHAFGSNLLGALAGGLLEYFSMATGFKALGLLALALYGASWLVLYWRPGLTPPSTLEDAPLAAGGPSTGVAWDPTRPRREAVPVGSDGGDQA